MNEQTSVKDSTVISALSAASVAHLTDGGACSISRLKPAGFSLRLRASAVSFLSSRVVDKSQTYLAGLDWRSVEWV